MRKLLLATFLACASISCAQAIDQPSSVFVRPVLSLELAIDLAKQTLLARNLNVSEHYLAAIHLESNTRGDRGAYWLITWQPTTSVKGGVIFVHVYMNRTTEVTFGE
jgi:hypothetical protein